MNKAEFLSALDRMTADLPREERERVAAYYAEMIDDRVEEGMTEAEAVEALGAPEGLLHGMGPASEDRGEALGSGEMPASEVNALVVCALDADVDIAVNPAAPVGIDVDAEDPECFSWRLENGALILSEIKAQKKHSGLAQLFDQIGKRTTRLMVTLNGVALERLEVRSRGGDMRVKGLKLSGDLMLNALSGDIRVENTSAEGNWKTHSTSGDVTIRQGFAGGAASVTSASGDVEMAGFDTAGQVAAGTASGDLTLDGMATGRIEAKTASGDVELRGVEAEQWQVNSASGDVEISRGGMARGQVQTLSGDIRLDETRVDASLRMDSRSGDVSARLLPRAGGYDIDASTRMGTLSLPNAYGDAPASIVVRTVTGDITLRMAE